MNVRHYVQPEAVVVGEVLKMERLKSALVEAEAEGWRLEVWHRLGISLERLAAMLAELLLLAVEEGVQGYSSRCGTEEELQISASSQIHPPLASSVVSGEVVVLHWRCLSWLWDVQAALGERLHQQIYLHRQVVVGL